MKVEQHFGVQEILDKLGEGGIGVVYRARDTRLGREVAVKLLHAQAVESSVRRDEAKALRRIPERETKFPGRGIQIVVENDDGVISPEPFRGRPKARGRCVRRNKASSRGNADLAV